MNAYGQAFEAEDDNGYPSKPVIELLDGELVGVDFHLNNGSASLAALLSDAENTTGFNPMGSSIIGYGEIDQDSFSVAVIDDQDGDGVEDDVDNCPSVANEDQANTDGADDGGDACDVDDDNDLICDQNIDVEGICIAGPAGGDNCRSIPNNDQLDSNENGCGDACITSGCFGVVCTNH